MKSITGESSFLYPEHCGILMVGQTAGLRCRWRDEGSEFPRNERGYYECDRVGWAGSVIYVSIQVGYGVIGYKVDINKLTARILCSYKITVNVIRLE